ncbi:LysR substrate-binding domain-containing protein [Erythrobacter sp. Alg231-14]|uniref:LysR substrate-binding domain-containing protein n=1 Tax=Erythrobacter sp. Alg231-14 TaxID=1922225 RepID=UPI00307C48BE
MPVAADGLGNRRLRWAGECAKYSNQYFEKWNNPKMDKLQAMRTFLEVARGQSFAAAGRALNASPATITRTIAALEESIGADLFIRTTRTVRLTEAGERYAPECERLLGEIDAAEALAAGHQAEPVGTLSITAPVLFGRLYIAPIVTEFCSQYPDVDVQLVLLDRVTNMVDEGFDIALRIGRMPDSSLKAVTVGSVRRVVAGSPDYLREHGVPRTPEDLKSHRIVAVTSAFSSVDWRFGKKDKTTIRVHPRVRCNNNATAIAIAASGWALTRVLSYQVGIEVNEGRLRMVLEDYEEEPLQVHLVHGGTRITASKVRAFIDFASKRLRANPVFG